MKRYLLGILAVIAMASCVQEQFVPTGMSGAISFNAPFVQSVPNRAAVDPSTTSGSIEAFDVWGFMGSNGGTVFDQKRVVRANGVWGYSAPIIYWAPNQIYHFAALSPVDNENIKVKLADNGKMSNEGALGTVTFTNPDGKLDLLYAQSEPITTASQEELIANTPVVSFVFQHLLTKVKFTFQNGFPSEYNSLKVTNIRMKVPNAGSVDLTQSRPYQWEVSSAYDALTLSFGNAVNAKFPSKGILLGSGEVGESEFECLTLPVKEGAKLLIEFDVELYQGSEVAIPKNTRTAELVFDGSINKVETGGRQSPLTALEQGKGYRINAILTGENVFDDKLLEIKFGLITVGEWEDNENPEQNENVDLQ